MDYWFAYTGESLLAGRGNLLSGVVTDAAATGRILKEASTYAADGTSVAALAAALARQELAPAPMPFTSAAQVMELFKGVDVAQAAVNLLNGRIVSAYAEMEGTQTLSTRIAKDLAARKLFMLPRDAERLHAPEALGRLPGALAFLLARAQADRQAFSRYLRRGAPPQITAQDIAAIAAMRPVLPTCKAIRADSAEDIASAIKAAPDKVGRAISQHWQGFLAQMRNRVGVADIALDEPYLPYLRAKHTLRYLARLEKFAAQEKSDKVQDHEPLRMTIYPLPEDGEGTPSGLDLEFVDYEGTGYGWENEDSDEGDYVDDESDGDEEDTLDGLASYLGDAENSLGLELAQELDSYRQQAFGLKEYIWRTAGDDKVRPEHAAREGQIFIFGEDEKPGDDYGCRCSAEPVLEQAGGSSLWDGITREQALELTLLLASLHPAGRAASIAVRAVGRLGRTGIDILRAARGRVAKPAERNIFERPDNVPKDWVQRPANKGDGIIYEQPGSKGASYVKIQKGNPNSSNPGQRVDNVRWTHNGQSLDRHGNIVPKQSQESHIPIEKFKFNPELFK